MLIEKLLFEKRKKKKEPKYVEQDDTKQSAFPEYTISLLKSSITKNSKDLDKKWKGAAELLDFCFEDLEIPKPEAYLKKRWAQYIVLLKYSVAQMSKSRGISGSWNKYSV